jgi:hypothetical protein
LKGKVKENWNKLVLSLIKAERVRFAKVQHWRDIGFKATNIIDLVFWKKLIGIVNL